MRSVPGDAQDRSAIGNYSESGRLGRINDKGIEEGVEILNSKRTKEDALEQENVVQRPRYRKRRKPKSCLTVPEVAKQLGYHSNTPYQWIKSGQLPAYRTSGGQHRIMRDDLRKFVEAYLEEEK